MIMITILRITTIIVAWLPSWKLTILLSVMTKITKMIMKIVTTVIAV